ncbi:MAG: hypothetical protein DRJ65_02800 [Acidobacteria bacterium]|nr:MAG: hypothetical protein DRJ65_02800 [Acidobacteriota bacterium]
MSLISDALRKARQETAEKEAKNRGMETPVVAGYWKRGGRLSIGLILGAVIAIGAAGIGGGMVWWVLVDRSVKGTVEAPDEISPAGAEIAEAQPDQASVELVLPQPGGVLAPTVMPVKSRPDDHDDLQAADSEAVIVDRIPDREEEALVEGPSPKPTLADGEYVGEAHVGDVTLTLDYLVYRKENPFAQINGRDVRVGAVIEDYVVETITENSVVLSQGDTRIVLRVQ